VRGRQNARSGSGLPPFLGATFCIKAKGGNIETYMKDKKKKDAYSNAFLRHAQDKLAQHDKVQKTIVIAVTLIK